ncbi:hypothetical protein ACFOHP_33890 [Couchioplanes caeruleus subsp. azureus]|nr:hypothetical protein [Couchioplanes caeruleus]
MFNPREGWGGAPGLRRDRDAEEGPRWRFVLSAGAFAIGAPDLARAERRYERAMQARQKTADALAAHLATHPTDAKGRMAARCDDCPTDPEPCREITSWSRKSRANMVRALCELDYRPLLNDRTRVPAMVTLTYPGDWLTVAPDGKAAKRHLQMFRKRFVKAWGHDVTGVWKLEFQERGAPHFHLLMVPPHGLSRIPGKKARLGSWVGAGKPFREWLSLVWADIVNHPDPEQRRRHERAGTGLDWSEGLRATDPKRVAVYFTKHGSFRKKEYQNCVPEAWQEPGKGPGRFWGYWVLQRVTVGVEVEHDDAVRAARLVRRWARAQGTTREVTVTRTKGGAIRSELAEVEGLAGAQTIAARTTRRRSVRRRVCRMKGGKGFVSVNNGEEFAIMLARALDVVARDVHEPGSPQMRLERLRAQRANQESVLQ